MNTIVIDGTKPFDAGDILDMLTVRSIQVAAAERAAEGKPPLSDELLLKVGYSPRIIAMWRAL